MDLHDHIDIYCERLEPGLWAEPLNAITNAAFIVAAIAGFMLAHKQGVLNRPVLLLIGLIAMIGIGSTLFHTFANVWSKFSDVLPILFFQIAFLVIYSRNIIGLNTLKTAGLIILFFGLSFLSGLMPYDWFNGSLGYSPALIFLLGFGIYHWKVNKKEPFILLITAGVFIVSLTFRSIDMLVCERLPIGVHYMWHILNGLVLYLSTRSIIVNWRN